MFSPGGLGGKAEEALGGDGLVIPRTGREAVPLHADGLMTNLRSLGVLALQTKPQHRI